MSLRDLLNLHNLVTVTKTISTNDGMGGITSTSSTATIEYAAIWQNGSVNRFIADKYAKDSTHQLVIEYGGYTFNNTSSLTSSQSMIETVSYNGNTFKTVGFADDVMNLHEIVMQSLERIS